MTHKNHDTTTLNEHMKQAFGPDAVSPVNEGICYCKTCDKEFIPEQQ